VTKKTLVEDIENKTFKPRFGEINLVQMVHFIGMKKDKHFVEILKI
jgi:hypothetical protein